MPMPPYTYWIETLKLAPHPEGGFFRETYRAGELLSAEQLPDRFGGPRTFSTAIYFLLPSVSFSCLHRIKSDEVWHFYTGTTLAVTVISPEGVCDTIRLGPHPEQGEVFQAVVPAGAWFGAHVLGPEGYALVGCSVSPGFDFADFELADREILCGLYPQHREVITALTRA